MNEKLTSKQPEMVTITEEHWNDFQQLVVNNANLEKENKELKQLLTAHIAEDECICNLDPDDTCPVKIFNEDCSIHGYEYEEVDGWVICPDCGREIHLPFPDENQIALGKLVEGVHEHGLTWTKELLVIKDWLQQEDK